MVILGDELLYGELVQLNRVRRDDLPTLTDMWSGVGFLRYLTRRIAYPVSLESMESWYSEEMGDPNTSPTFAIRSREDGRLLGMCALKDIRWASRHAMCWIGIGDPAMRGRGYGSDAMRVLLRFAFMDMNLNCIALEVFSYNKPALAAYRKLGFKDDGVLRAYLYRDGEYYDMHLMSMLRGEWSVLYGGQ